MKIQYIYRLTLCLFLLLALSCQTEESLNGNGDMGYLRIEASSVTSTETKSIVPENYKPKQLYVEIRNEAGTVVTSTDDYDTHWKGTKITLKAGTYTITASSNGFDGQASGFDIPYYRGTKQISVIAGKEVSAEVVCTLANVKVSVSFADNFKQAFTSAKVKIISTVTGIASQEVTMGSTQSTPSIYLPVGNFKAELEVKNAQNTTHTLTKELTEVKARDHYLLNYKLADQGNASIKIEADSKEQEYNFTFNVSKEVATSLGVKRPSAWSTFALLEGEVISSTGVLDPACMTFEYKKQGETSDWTTVESSGNNLIFTAKAKGLTPNTNYTYRMVYKKGDESFTSESLSFQTEEQIPLVNGNMENWYQNGKIWYPDSETNANSSIGSFWDTSNPGGAKYIGSNTSPDETSVHTSGGKAAKLESKYAVIKFAAASLYTGKFLELIGTSGAKLRFGQPFTSRPTQLRVWAKYNGGSINRTSNNLPSGTVAKGDPDLWSALIALVDVGTKDGIEVDNTNMSTFPDYNTDNRVVAYGAIPDAACGNTDWKQFTIDLVYRDLTRKPTHIIIVISSSKYGDYFTGSDSSVLYVDDMELIYGENPQTK